MNENIVFYAFRYCLGRSTYVVSDCVGYLIEHWENLSDDNQATIVKEIRSAIKSDKAGMSMDVAEWEKVLVHDLKHMNKWNKHDDDEGCR